MKGKLEGFWPKPVGGYPTKKAAKITNGGNCAHEGELVPMKGKIVEFWLEPVRAPLQKKPELVP